jgi:glucose-6-phosphate 1-dehydrogenase
MNPAPTGAAEVELADNPLREGSVTLRAAEPCAVVVFGATGDLAHRKLFPALCRISTSKALHPRTAVLGTARSAMDAEAFRKDMGAAVAEAGIDPREWRVVAERVDYISADFGDPASYAAIKQRLEALERERGLPGNRIFHLAVPPAIYGSIIDNLGRSGLVHPHSEAGPWARVVVEKPFGHDLDSARELNRCLHTAFDERQVFRIDHYLGKESVQNILILRLGNGFFEPLWNNRYVDHVQITVAESLGIEGRAAYYEGAGVSRDILQNHLMQLLSLTAMEPPARFEADSVRDEKVKVLRAIRPLDPEDVALRTVRGQYGHGAVAGEPVPGYCEEPGVAPKSKTETYLAVRLDVDNWRWAGVPFYLRSGKRLAKRATEIEIVFRQPPYALFRTAGISELDPNVLRMRIQPDEGVSVSFGAKSPGAALHIDPVRMDFYYLTAFGSDPPDAYDRLLLDCNRGDMTLFAREDEVELAWEIVDSITKTWEKGQGAPLTTYAAGTWGPREADAWIAKDGRKWLHL